MTHFLRQLWHRNRLGLIAFSVAVLVTLFFALRFAVFWIYWSDPAHQNQPIEGWMTPGYVAYSHHVPKETVIRALGVTPNAPPHRTLQDIAQQSGRTVEELTALLDAAIAAERQGGQ